ncbi:unnamed protein product, partial [Pleuronectes platessa]
SSVRHREKQTFLNPNYPSFHTIVNHFLGSYMYPNLHPIQCKPVTIIIIITIFIVVISINFSISFSISISLSISISISITQISI